MTKSYTNEIDMPSNHIEWHVSTVIELIICIAIPLLVGVLAAFFTKDAMLTFNTMAKPPLAPPAWLFPVAWTILYILMGIASFLILNSRNEGRAMGLMLYVMCIYRPDSAHCTAV